MTSRHEQPPHATGGPRPPHRADGAARPPAVTPPGHEAGRGSDPDSGSGFHPNPNPEPDPGPDRRSDHGSGPGLNSVHDPGPDAGPDADPGTAPGPTRPPLPATHLDGLYTYCLSLLQDPEAATAALVEALVLAERRADRAPAADGLRPWRYALARWACQRRLAAGQVRPPGCPGPRQRAELGRLVWPEAAGTDGAQREALELAVRHGLAPDDVAMVLRLDLGAARALLAGAACEVERTRTALAVVASGRCPVVARFAAGGGDAGAPLGASVRGELVRHVDDCAECRRTAERVTAGAPWPGTAAARDGLPLVGAPLAAVRAALRRADPGPQRLPGVTGGPRYDREGFPLPPPDRADRLSRLRHRAVTTTVVATVAAAPALALWAACRATPPGGRPGGTVAGEAPADGSARDRTEEADGAPEAAPGTGTPPPAPPGLWGGPGRLTLAAQPSGADTAITLTAVGEEVHWAVTADKGWLRLSRRGGVLAPGRSVTFTVSADPDREPAGPWRARVRLAPGASVVTVGGPGRLRRPGTGDSAR